MARPRSERARQSVLAAMRRALAEGGYQAVTIEGLAAEAGVAKQTIYRWWPSKAAILGEALLEGELPGSDAAFTSTGDLAADVRAWFAAASAHLGQGPGLALARALIEITATDPELGEALNERFAGPVVTRVAERLAQAQDAGQVRADVDPAAVADQFIAMASYSALRGRPLDEARIDAAVDLLLRGIEAG